MPSSQSTTAADHARRLPPLWWIKRRIKITRYRGGWHASYRWGNQTWGVTTDTRDEAGTELLETMRGVKDGSTLAEYYKRYGNA